MMTKHSERKTVTLLVTGIACLLMVSCIMPEKRNPSGYIGPRPDQMSAVSRDTEKVPNIVQPGPNDAAVFQGPLELTVQDAILMALENNRALRVEKFNPLISATAEEEARAEFDPLIAGQYARSREKTDSDVPRSGGKLENENNADMEVSTRLPTGTDVGLELSTEQAWSDLYSDDLHGTRIGLSVTQALLRERGLDYNLARLRQARLDTTSSEYELRGFAEALIAEVETTYWNYGLIERQIEIFLESLRLAEQQKEETEEMIRIGTLAESELAAAEAEIALRREGLINARSNLAQTRLALLRLVNPRGSDLWKSEILLINHPAVPEVTLDDVEAHVDVALRMRPDLNQARLQVKRGDLEVAKTKNGTLPKMDFFISLGKTGYAESFGSSVGNIDGDSYDILAGINLEYPFGNREARARHQRSILSRDQAEAAVMNMVQLVQVDIRSAYIEVNRTREQIAATAATRASQQEKARVEMEKFRVGKSTTLLVAAAQRDFLARQISEIQAITNYLKSLIALYRLEGSLLERRGIAAPGGGRE